jgi:hypothetical protein
MVPLCTLVSFVVIGFVRLSAPPFPNRFLPQQVLARITYGCDKLRGHPKFLVFLNEIMTMHKPRPLEVS